MTRVLMVVTSHAKLGASDEATGFWLEELAAPYQVFLGAGYEIDLASPQGGAAPVDPRSTGGARPPAVEAFLADPAAMAKAAATLPLASVDAAAYRAVFLVGGHGTMWDFADNPTLGALLGALYDRGDVVAAVCHGPAGLVGARRADGRPLIDGRRVTGFTNAEEKAAKLDGIVPFALESRLVELGARFEGGPPWQPHAVRDGNLVTGQNPASSGPAAEAVVAALS